MPSQKLKLLKSRHIISSQSKHLASFPFPSFPSSLQTLWCLSASFSSISGQVFLFFFIFCCERLCFGNNNHVDCCSDDDDMDEKNTALSCVCLCQLLGCQLAKGVWSQSLRVSTFITIVNSTLSSSSLLYCHRYCHVIIIIILTIVIVIVGCCS